MPPKFVGYGIEDYSMFAAGAPVLVLTGPRSERLFPAGSPFAGRLVEPFRPGVALLMREGPLASVIDLRRAVQIHHWITERRLINEPAEAFQLALDASDESEWVVVMLDTRGIVDEIERRGNAMRWPEHWAFAKRISAAVDDAAAMHRQHLHSLLYR